MEVSVGVGMGWRVGARPWLIVLVICFVRGISMSFAGRGVS